MTEDQIKHMVNRFLGWKLPENFSPDAGISFKATYNENTPYPAKHEPIGTNLFDYSQAEAMMRYIADGIAVSKDTGGPAFPCSNEQFTSGNSQSGDAAPGITYLDYAAIAAMQGMMARDGNSVVHMLSPEKRAKMAYIEARAMLAERDKP
jgi:hypothetical protein